MKPETQGVLHLMLSINLWVIELLCLFALYIKGTMTLELIGALLLFYILTKQI